MIGARLLLRPMGQLTAY